MENTLRKTISLTKEHQKYLDDNPELKLSSIVRSKINEIMQTRKNFEEQLRVKNVVIDRLNNKIIELREELDKSNVNA